MSLFSCKTCKAHEAHIQSLESQIQYLKQQLEPAQHVGEIIESLAPIFEPIFIPTAESTPTKELADRDFAADQLLIGDF